MKALNRAFLWLHRWTGIGFAIVFVVVGLSGTVLTFRYEIQQLVHPDELLVRLPAGVTPDFENVAAKLGEQIPGARPAFLQMNPAKASFPMRIVAQMPDETVQVRYAHPVSGQLVHASIDERFWRMMRDLHIFLLLGFPGLLVVFLSGWVLIGCSLLGTWLWAPRLRKPRLALGVRWRANLRKLMLDLHNVTGVYLLVPMLLLGLTGVTLILARLNPPEMPAPVAPTGAEAESAIAVVAGHDALATALDLLAYPDSGQRIQQVKFPTAQAPWFAFEVSDPEHGFQILLTDRTGTRRLATVNERDATLWARLKGELGVALHEGYILGDFGRWIVFICGLTLSVGSVTGVWLWLIRRARLGRRPLA